MFFEYLLPQTLSGPYTDKRRFTQQLRSGRSGANQILRQPKFECTCGQLYMYIQGIPIEIQTPIACSLIAAE